MTEFNVGDRIRVESFTGTITDLSAHRGGLCVRDDDGWYHEVFPYSDQVKLTKVEPPRPNGQLVCDRYGDVFIYEPDENPSRPWRLVYKNSLHWWPDGDIGERYPASALLPELVVLTGAR